MTFPTEKIDDNERLNRWAYNPAVGENPPHKGLKFKSDAPHNSCESCNWYKYMGATAEIHKNGLAKSKSSQEYLGFYDIPVAHARNVHKGKAYEGAVWFEIDHTPLDENQAHTDIKIVKNEDTHKIVVKQAKIDLAREVLSDLIPK